MNYEKKYNEALERARELHGTVFVAAQDLTELIFPELRESEDERIRRCVLACIENAPSDCCMEVSRMEMRDWLEKQKEQMPAEWSEEDERAINCACVALRAYAHGDLPEFLPSELMGYADRLQSLRFDSYKNCNSRWKPSEEQEPDYYQHFDPDC